MVMVDGEDYVVLMMMVMVMNINMNIVIMVIIIMKAVVIKTMMRVPLLQHVQLSQNFL